jgi:hypothetical protein
MFATVLVYGTLFVERQLWWLMLPCLAIFLASFIALPLVLESARVGTTPQRVVQSALLVLAFAVFVRWHVKDRMPYPWQPDVRRSQLDIEARLPPAALIGCFNAGIPQYFGAGRVVALDGLVNHDVQRYWKERRVDAYLRDHGIGFIADEERTLQRVRRFTEMSLELEERASYPLPGWPTGRRLLWEVMRPPRGRTR